MKRSLRAWALSSVVASVVLGTAASVVAAPAADEEFAFADEAPAAASGSTYEYQSTPVRQQAPSIVQQKAQARAAQRMSRIASMKWYGFSGTRPVAAGIAFTSMYSPAWQMPGGRPFAWYSTSRPVLIIQR